MIEHTTVQDSSVHAAFVRIAAQYPDAPFLRLPARADREWAPAGFTLTYAEVRAQVGRLVEAYRQAGYVKGQRVATLLSCRPEFFFHFLALNALGISLVPINPDYRHDEMLYQMEHSEAVLAVVLPERRTDLERVAAARLAAGGRLLPVVDGLDLARFDGTAHPRGGLPRADGGTAAGRVNSLDTASGSEPAAPAGPDTASRSLPDLDTEASLLYTSGTTGRPKGCRLSNFYHLNSGELYRVRGGALALDTGREVFYNPLPLYHMNALVVTATCAILSANCFVLVERFSPQRWWPEVVQSGATIIHYLGIVAPTLLNQTPSDDERRHQVRFGLGAGIEPSLHAQFEQRFGFPMIEVWGMTETGRIFTVHEEPREIHTRAFGRPFEGLQARVVDDQDREVLRGQTGELLVRYDAERPRHGFFSGYLKNDAATEEAWRGGWFHTGDVVTQDASGMLYFVDRKKHIIRRSGENIAAAEIEAVLQAHEAVAQVAVLPAPDGVREEEVFACIVPMAGVEPDQSLALALFDWTDKRLAYYKAPGWLLFLDTLPTTGTQKVQKAQIFQAGEDPRQRPGVYDLRSRKKRS